LFEWEPHQWGEPRIYWLDEKKGKDYGEGVATIVTYKSKDMTRNGNQPRINN